MRYLSVLLFLVVTTFASGQSVSSGAVARYNEVAKCRNLFDKGSDFETILSEATSVTLRLQSDMQSYPGIQPSEKTSMAYLQALVLASGLKSGLTPAETAKRFESALLAAGVNNATLGLSKKSLPKVQNAVWNFAIFLNVESIEVVKVYLGQQITPTAAPKTIGAVKIDRIESLLVEQLTPERKADYYISLVSDDVAKQIQTSGAINRAQMMPAALKAAVVVGPQTVYDKVAETLSEDDAQKWSDFCASRCNSFLWNAELDKFPKAQRESLLEAFGDAASKSKEPRKKQKDLIQDVMKGKPPTKGNTDFLGLYLLGVVVKEYKTKGLEASRVLPEWGELVTVLSARPGGLGNASNFVIGVAAHVMNCSAQDTQPLVDALLKGV